MDTDLRPDRSNLDKAGSAQPMLASILGAPGRCGVPVVDANDGSHRTGPAEAGCDEAGVRLPRLE
jgi:hypothetical protein